MKKSVRPEWEQRWMRLAASHPQIDLEIAQVFGKAGEDYKVAKGSVTGFISGDGVGGYGNPLVPRYSGDVNAMIALIVEKAPAERWVAGRSVLAPGDTHRKHYAGVGTTSNGSAELPAVALAIALRHYLEKRAAQPAKQVKRPAA